MSELDSTPLARLRQQREIGNLLPNNQVERLNEIQQRVEREKDSHTKFLLRVEWMEEKQRPVGLLKKVHPFPISFPPASKRQT